MIQTDTIMKKLLSLILLLGLSLAFYSCGGDDDKEDEKFVWNGDWNDPDDPNYKPEGYNPIQGLWRSVKDNTYGLYYSKDFKGYRVNFSATGDNYSIDGTGIKYQLNDKAYKNDFYYRYRIEGDFLYVSTVINGSPSEYNWAQFKRAKEKE